ncbi:MAG: hypothetical protein ACD_13C00157G0023 [uncultured bacterium]|nr:MAG: hypothetical protein ACD_13C00157G0023 [uncultured bacterium]
MDKNYGGVIWTNHALDRLRERGIKQGDAWVTFRRPESLRKGNSGNWIYYRTYPPIGQGVSQKIEVVAKQNEKKEWLIVSVWSRSVYKTDRKNKSFWKIIFKKIFGKHLSAGCF